MPKKTIYHFFDSIQASFQYKAHNYEALLNTMWAFIHPTPCLLIINLTLACCMPVRYFMVFQGKGAFPLRSVKTDRRMLESSFRKKIQLHITLSFDTMGQEGVGDTHITLA